MRRLAGPILLGLAVAAVVIALVATSGGGSGNYRVDVIFDNSRGLTPGQLVEVAGARVGTIQAIHLTPDYKARIELSVDPRFAPFRRNATCTIRPQGLLAEYYVECDPGSPASAPLPAAQDGTPTVPVTHTTQPIALTDLFDIWSAPVRERLSLLVSQLGISTAGRGQEINDILRRSNPSLAAARRVIGILQGQRAQLDALLTRTGKAIGPLAQEPQRVGAFIQEAARASEQTSAHSVALAQSVNRLPAMLAAAQPDLHALDTVISTGTPLARELGAAAPSLNRLSTDLGPFARQVGPTLQKLRPVLVQGTSTLKRSIPVSRAMRDYTHNSRAAAELAGPLFLNLQKRGFGESLLLFMYRGAASAARFDQTSHILPAFSIVNDCSNPATTPTPGCQATFTNATSTAKAVHRRARRGGVHAPAQTNVTVPGAAKPNAKNPLAPVQQLLNKIVPPVTPPQPNAPNNVNSLLNYLLG